MITRFRYGVLIFLMLIACSFGRSIEGDVALQQTSTLQADVTMTSSPPEQPTIEPTSQTESNDTSPALTLVPPNPSPLGQVFLSVQPVQTIEGSYYIVLPGPLSVSATTSNATRVEFFTAPPGTGSTPKLEYSDANGSDGWGWTWRTPLLGAHLWAEAVHADGSRTSSQIAWLLTPEAFGTPPPPEQWLLYTNEDLSYSVEYPSGWTVDEYGLRTPGKEILFSPPNPEPFIAYFSILLESRTIDQIKDAFARDFPDIPPIPISIAAQSAILYRYNQQRQEIFAMLPRGIFRIATDKATMPEVQHMLSHFYLIMINPSIDHRIRFAPGATSARLEGSIRGQDSYNYVLYALQDQYMSITLTSPDNNVWLTLAGDDGIPLSRSAVGAPTHWEGVLQASQDYHISAVVEQPTSESTTYTLDVSITN